MPIDPQPDAARGNIRLLYSDESGRFSDAEVLRERQGRPAGCSMRRRGS